jgi:phosphotransferase system HPr (HPr) family protein
LHIADLGFARQSEIGNGSFGNELMPKLAIEVVVSNCEGLHARPAMQFVDVANRFGSNVVVYRENDEAGGTGDVVDGKSVMQMITLGAAMGTTLKIEADGEDASAALESLKKLFDEKFGEE